MNKIVIIILIILSIAEIFVFYCLKKYNDSNKILYFIVAIILYIIIAYLLSYSFKFNNMAIINSMWNAVSIVLVVLLGYFVFHESLTANEITAIILIIIATILIIKK